MLAPNTTKEILLEKLVEDSMQGPTTLLNSSHPATMIQENGRLGALFWQDTLGWVWFVFTSGGCGFVHNRGGLE